eukprot:2163064-Prymnesium_polylepis.1
MPLGSRSKQLSNVLDPARFGQWDRLADRPVRCAALQRARMRASSGMSACYCFRNDVLGG